MLHGRGGKRRRRIDPRARAFLRDLWTEADTGENCRDGTLSAGRRGVWMDWRSRADGADGGGCAGVVCRDGGSGSGRCAECAGARSRDCGGRAARAARGNPGGSGAGDSHAGNVGGSRTCRETAGGTGVSCGAFPFGGTGSSAGAVVVFLWAGDRKIVDGRDKGAGGTAEPDAARISGSDGQGASCNPGVVHGIVCRKGSGTRRYPATNGRIASVTLAGFLGACVSAWRGKLSARRPTQLPR